MISRIKDLYKKSPVFSAFDKTFSNRARKRLTNHDFTILCPNCIGGLIYHRLGERFNSPTVNISMDTPDFASLLRHLDYYLEQDPVETTPREDGVLRMLIQGNGADIHDIIINLVHYHTFESGREKWNERKKRIKRDNTYVIMYDIGDLNTPDVDKAGFASESDLEAFNAFECNNKVLLTRNKNCNNPYAFYIEPDLKGPFPLVYLKKGFDGRDYYEKYFDFTDFINKK